MSHAVQSANRWPSERITQVSGGAGFRPHRPASPANVVFYSIAAMFVAALGVLVTGLIMFA